MKKKIFKLTAKELKVLRAGKSAAGCNGASWSSASAKATTGERRGPGKPKATPIKPRAIPKK